MQTDTLKTYAQYCESIKRERMDEYGISASDADSMAPTHTDWLSDHIVPAIKANPNPCRRRLLACAAAYPWDLMVAIRSQTGLIWDGSQFIE